MTSATDNIKDRIDDYKDTIFAITGFINLYRFNNNTRQMRSDVVVFQGRRLTPPNGSPVTPDLGVLHHPSTESVLGEVKKSFPQDEGLWMDDFRQLMSYDEDLAGWPTSSGKVSQHDVVLLLHHSRAAKVNRFYQAKKGNEIVFQRPFAIVEFSRSDERKSYLFLRIVDGRVSASEVNSQLSDGVQIPMLELLAAYSKVKFYDAEPPLPYLMELIWTNVVTLKASENEKFGRLRKDQKLDVAFSVDDIVKVLHDGYSFHGIPGADGNNGPQIPKREWVLNACKGFIESGDAAWTNAKVGDIVFYFRRHDDVLNHFLEKTSASAAKAPQMDLFQN